MAKLGTSVLGVILAQEISGLTGILPEVGGYGIIVAAMVWAWRTTSRTQREAFEVAKSAQDRAREIDLATISQLRAEIARLQAQVALLQKDK